MRFGRGDSLNKFFLRAPSSGSGTFLFKLAEIPLKFDKAC